MLQDRSNAVARTLMGTALLLATGAVQAADHTPKTLDAITVSGENAPQYRAQAAMVGPLGEKSLLDTHYSLQVVTRNLFQNQQFKNVRDAFGYLPLVQGDNIRPQTRGLQAGVVHNTRMTTLNTSMQ